MIRPKKPAEMSRSERLEALGAVLAAGYRRFRFSREKGLAESPAPERACDRTVDAPESTKEVA